jgi:predicted secreted hydrolase
MQDYLKIITVSIALLWNAVAYANLPFFPLSFPRDDAAHAENIPYTFTQMTEWWYFSGKLDTVDGKHFAYYFSLNRYINKTQKIDLPVLTIQMVDLDNKKVYADIIPYPNFLTHFDNQHLNIALADNFELSKANESYYVKFKLPLYNQSKATVFDVALIVTPTNGRLLVNKNGMVELWDKSNSYYYAYTSNKTEGILKVGNNVQMIDSHTSNSYIDHQWGDFVVTANHPWFWQHISLTNKIDIIGGMSVDPITKKADPGLVEVVFPDGRRFDTMEFTLTPEKIGADHYPLSYTFSVPSIQLSLEIDSKMVGQCATGICEAMSDVSGEMLGKLVSGYDIAETTVKY